MGLSSLELVDSRLSSSQPHVLQFYFTVTGGAVTQVLTKNLPPIIFGTAAGDFTQAAVNALLEYDSNGDPLSAASTSEIDTSVAFGSTAMGIDAFGFVISCGGQIADVAGVEAIAYIATEDGKFAAKVSSLPDTLTAGLLVTPAGNLVGRVIPTGLDAGTGVLVLKIHVFPK